MQRSKKKNKKDMVSYISVGVRKEEAHQFLRGNPALDGKGCPVTGRLASSASLHVALMDSQGSFSCHLWVEAEEETLTSSWETAASAESYVLDQGSWKIPGCAPSRHLTGAWERGCPGSGGWSVEAEGGPWSQPHRHSSQGGHFPPVASPG